MLQSLKMWILLMIIAGFISCRKDQAQRRPDPAPPSSQKVNLIAVNSSAGGPVLEKFEYDSSNRLAAINGSRGGGLPTKIMYDKNDRPVKAEVMNAAGSQIAFVYDFFYKDERMDKLVFSFVSDGATTKKSWTWKYAYANNSAPSKVTEYATTDSGDILFAKTTLTYYANGDLKTKKREERYQDDSSFHVSETSYEYDLKNYPMKSFSKFLTELSAYLQRAVHNITKEIYTEGENRKIVQITSRRYTYNGHGYPLTSFEKYENPDYPADNYSDTLRYTYRGLK